MEDSILESIKNNLGIPVEDDVFDGEIIMAINTAFMTLSQLGVGLDTPFIIEDSLATWSDFTEDVEQLPMIKSYICLQTRLSFDPPASNSLMTAMQEKSKEYEWRLNVSVDRPE